MNISFPNNFLSSERQNFYQNLRGVTESQSGRKTVSSNKITAETGVDKEENDRLLRKMQLAQTKAEVMEHYFGAMQTAVRESGSNGIAMNRRVTHLTGTQKAYTETDQYKKKKDKDTFLLDQLEALKKRQEEIEELREAQAEEQEDTRRYDEDNTQSASRETSSNSANESQQRRNLSNVQNVDLQKRAAQSYKKMDAPSRNPYVQDVFTGMI